MYLVKGADQSERHIVRKPVFGVCDHGWIQRKGQGVRPPEKSQNYRVSFPGPLKITKLPSQHSMLGQDDPFISVFGSSIPSLTQLQRLARILSVGMEQ